MSLIVKNMDVIVQEQHDYPKVFLHESGIFHVDYGLCSRLTLDVVLKMQEKTLATQKGDDGRKYVVLVNSKYVTAVDKDAQSILFSQEIGEKTKACAIMLHQKGFNWLVGELYLFFDKPPYPCRFFTRESKAIAWLKTNM
jgi:hypothetical protein